MRRAVLTVAVLVALAGADVGARGQSLDLASPEAKRIRAILAWQRAVWHVNREDFERARVQLEKAFDADAKPDGMLPFTLGLTYLRLSRVSEADVYLARAKKLMPSYSGLLFTDAFRLAVTKAKDAAESKELVRAALDKYREFFERLDDDPGDGAFVAELKFLGHVYRGLLESRVPEEWDQAVKDLDAAKDLAQEKGWSPAAEVVSLLAEVHKSLDQMDSAKKVVREAMARDPAEASHYYNYGALLLSAREYASAKPWFDAALTRRSDLIDAHLKLAFIGWQLHDPAAMLPHLEAVKAVQELRVKGGAPPDLRADADVDSGFGVYWKLVGEARSDAGDETGAMRAFETAANFFRTALTKEPGCVQALNMLIQLSSRIPIPQQEIEELKRRLQDLNENREHTVEPYKSTFC